MKAAMKKLASNEPKSKTKARETQSGRSEGLSDFYNALMQTLLACQKNPDMEWSANVFYNLVENDRTLSGYIAERDPKTGKMKFRAEFGAFTDEARAKRQTAKVGVK